MKIDNPHCVVWKNPSREEHPQSRLLQALTSHGTPPLPLAIPREELQSFRDATYVSNEDEFIKNLNSSSQQAPLILSTELATQLLGWDSFQPSHYLR